MHFKKILWLNTYADYVGGCEYYIANIVKNLNQNGVQHILLYDPAKDYSVDFLKIFSEAYPACDLPRQFAELQPDVIFVHQLSYAHWFDSLHAASYPVIFYVHDSQVFSQKEFSLTTYGRKSCYPASSYKWHHALLGACFPAVLWWRSFRRRCGLGPVFFKKYLQAKHFLVGSKYMKEHLQFYGVAGDKIAVIPLFVLPPSADFQRQVEAGRIIFVGQLVRGKGVDTLLRAVSLLPSVKLTIIGSGKQERELKQLSVELGLSDRVDFLGRVCKESLQKHWQMADICVIPSRIPESFCLTALDAMAHSVPLIATSLGGMSEWHNPEIVTAIKPNDENELREALQTLLANPVDKAQRAEKGLKFIQDKFTLDKHIDSLRHYFEESLHD